MEIEQERLKVGEILDLFQNGMLRANSEYQRGVVWSVSQKKKLIDSVMRGYPLPLIYLHHIQKSVAGMSRDDLEIIDGQQRINSLDEFRQGVYSLFDPVKDDAQARFPKFLKEQPCPWAGLPFQSLPEALAAKFLDAELPIARITSDDANEVRDLFVRLQSGLPLNPQEKRDAYPGGFTDFILRVGGKPAITKYPGHPFFQRVMRMNPGKGRGKTRTLAAQIAMLYFSRREGEPDRFTGIDAQSIDDFYYTNIDFDADSTESKRLTAILDKLDQLLGDGKRPRLGAHIAIHLVLLIDSLWDDYTRSWESKLPAAVDQFSHALTIAAKTQYSSHPDEYWSRYSQWTYNMANRGDSIRRRHEFYANRMYEFLSPLAPKDPKRTFGSLERELIYFRDGKKCAIPGCGGEVAWDDAEIHHVEEHAQGGPTILENGVLVHRHCHPKGNAAQEFAESQETVE